MAFIRQRQRKTFFNSDFKMRPGQILFIKYKKNVIVFVTMKDFMSPETFLLQTRTSEILITSLERISHLFHNTIIK